MIRAAACFNASMACIFSNCTLSFRQPTDGNVYIIIPPLPPVVMVVMVVAGDKLCVSNSVRPISVILIQSGKVGNNIALLALFEAGGHKQFVLILNIYHTSFFW